MEQHLKILEQEAIELIREVITTNDLRDVWSFYSIGKDSCVMHRLIEKAFYPRPVGIRFLHIDTGYKFREMYEFRDNVSARMDLAVYKTSERRDPWSDADYTDVMKTQALREAFALYDIKVAFGGGRREEEKSRAKEKMVSVRGRGSAWNPREQNPEINKLWNTAFSKETTLRVFPLSNWTELDIWEYVLAENIEVVPIYFSHERNVTEKNGLLLPTQSEDGERRRVRFRTLGCYPLTAAIESEANSVEEIIAELRETQYTERCGRIIDKDSEGAMEKKKSEGYF